MKILDLKPVSRASDSPVCREKGFEPLDLFKKLLIIQTINYTETYMY